MMTRFYSLRRVLLFSAILFVAAFRVTAQHDMMNIPGNGTGGHSTVAGGHSTVAAGPPVVSLGPDISACEGTTVGAMGAFTLDRSSIDFGELDGCTGWRDEKVRLRNTGDADLMIERLSGSGDPFTVIDPLPGFLVRTGEETDVTIRFAPSSVGTHTASLSLVATVADDPSCSIEQPLDLRGRILQMHVAAETNTIEFEKGTDCRATQRDTIFHVFNNGTASITLNEGIVGAPYTILSPTFPITIPPGKKVGIEIRCEPSLPGAYVDDLLLPYVSGECADTIRVRLRSLFDFQIVTSSHDEIDFDTVTGCAAGAEQTIRLKNREGVGVRIVEGPISPGFSIRSGLPAIIGPNGTAPVTVRFEPTTTGTLSGTMHLVVEPCGVPLSIRLKGTGLGTNYKLPTTIDFGDIPLCAGRPDPIASTLLLEENGEGEGSVVRVTVLGPFSTTLKGGTVLTPGEPFPFDVSFNSTAPGPASGSIVMRLDPCGIERTIELSGSRSRMSATAAGALFQPMTSGTTATRPVTVTNNGAVPIRVERIEGLLPPFTVVQTLPPLPAELKPGENLTVTVEFKAEPGIAEGTLRAIITSPCDTVITTTVQGTGTVRKFAKVVIPSLSAEPGERFRLPVLLAESNGLEEETGFRFQAVIEFDGSAMVTNGSFPSPGGDPGLRHVRVSGPVRPGNDTLAVIDAVATLGRTDRSELRFVEAGWISSQQEIVTATRNGELVLEGICRDGNDRLIAIGREAALRPSRPDPSSGTVEIDYTLIEHGAIQLSLYDMQGRLTATLFDGEAAPGLHTTRADLGTLPPGIYICVLKTPSQTFHSRLTVAR